MFDFFLKNQFHIFIFVFYTEQDLQQCYAYVFIKSPAQCVLLQVSLVRAAKAHGWQSLVQYNIRAVQSLQSSCSPALHRVLHRLCCLFALHGIETNTDNFLEVFHSFITFRS